MANEFSIKGPVGGGQYVVEQGECILSIAEKTGFFWQTLWDHPENRALKDARGDPNILLPGDRVFIPEKRIRTERIQTGQTHTFVKKGSSARLRVRILKGGQARANETYRLCIDDKWTNGRLDADGLLDVAIPARAARGRLEVGPDRQTFEFQLGGVDPIDSVSGIQTRLNNLGYGSGAPDGVLGPLTKRALRSFQKSQGLPETGEPDEATLKTLRDVHGG